MNQFISNPMIMEIDSKVWSRIKEKSPKDCIEENDERDLKLLQTIANTGFHFRYGLEQTMRILQLQFLQLPTMIQEEQDVENLKIIFRAL